MKFILSDGTLNRNGFIVHTNGIDTTEFEENPQMLFNHNSDMPIGIWKSVYKEGDNLLGEAEFDMDDPESIKIYKKVEKGHIKSTSIGIKIVDWDYNDDGSVIIHKSQLREASIVPLPANKNAIKLFLEEKEYADLNELKLKLSEKQVYNMKEKEKEDQVVELNEEKVVELNENEIETPIEKEEVINFEEKYNDTFVKLSALSATLEAKETENIELKNEILSLKEMLSVYKKNEIDSYIENAIKEGKFTVEQKESLTVLANDNYVALKNLVENAKSVKKPQTSISNHIEAKKEEQVEFDLNNKSTWGFNDYRKNAPDELKLMKVNEPEKFDKLYNDYINKK